MLRLEFQSLQYTVADFEVDAYEDWHVNVGRLAVGSSGLTW